MKTLLQTAALALLLAACANTSPNAPLSIAEQGSFAVAAQSKPPKAHTPPFPKPSPTGKAARFGTPTPPLSKQAA